jgi:hypothetical protein
MFKSLLSNNLLFSIVLLGAIVSLVAIGGLALFCFTKVFSIVFLGNPRSSKTEKATEVRKDMLIPLFIISFFILGIGLFPFLIIKPLAIVTGIFVPDTSVLQSMTGSLSGISISLGAFLVMIAALWLIKIKVAKNHSIAEEATWGCAYTGAVAAVHQYTATSYSEYIVKKAKLLVGVKKHFKPLTKNTIFPPPTKFETHSSDIFEDNLILKPVRKLFYWMEKIAVFQTGNIQHYLLYAIVFVIAISLLTLLNVI